MRKATKVQKTVMEGGRLALLILLVGVSSVEFSDCAYRDHESPNGANGHVDDDADSVVVEDDALGEEEEEEDGSTTTAATTAAKAEDLLREIVNYGLEQGRHFWFMTRRQFWELFSIPGCKAYAFWKKNTFH